MDRSAEAAQGALNEALDALFADAERELAGVEAHHLELVAVGVVAPSESHLLGVEVDEAVVGDGGLVDPERLEHVPPHTLTHTVTGYGSVTEAAGVTVTVVDNDPRTPPALQASGLMTDRAQPRPRGPSIF